MPNYLDIFAGAGGLSEGFIRAGYEPVAHIEMDTAACYTLKTRLAYKWLADHNQEVLYNQYLQGIVTRAELYDAVPDELLNSVLNYEISEECLEEIFETIDGMLNDEPLELIVGGPPCQAYSLVGRARDENGMVGDQRNYLYILYAKFLNRYHPKYFVFENVVGLFSAKDTDGELYLEKMQQLFRECGYSIEYRLLNAKDYGVLQNRERIILVGKYGEHSDFYPDIPAEENIYMVQSVFYDLPKIHAGEGVCTPVPTLHYNGQYLYFSRIKEYDLEPVTFHCARPHTQQDLEIYRRVVQLWNDEQKRMCYSDLPNELQSQNNLKSFLDRFKVVAANLSFSQTVVAHISKDGHYFIHPDLEQNRSLTPREVARLQTFPDNYYFESVSGKPSRTAAFKQIGNAVPVLLAEKIATALLEVW
ncbi:DNA cytosine methyltransferase [Acetobacterium woodii]|uniref:Cytosine-specific methyltransferase n=1 Tax=Acetobacterium woodii (strain ATCC 29683 / DSM 1030 / JCM 2381 / KCTC 1655 / WB1) TaxID=931626 RepID=H6LJP1_ACEWD|nr:DNA cytosine methyltransferase [Acetobacterium woodii]AFA47442.1 DNA (cytosine-5-)-methyltransferase Dcm [Acetobacterium woodii DSM 1030]